MNTRMHSIKTRSFLIFNGDTVINGSIEHTSAIIVRNGNLFIGGDVESFRFGSAACVIVVENGDLHITGNVMHGGGPSFLIASGKITVDGKCETAVIEGRETAIKDFRNCTFYSKYDKPYDPKESDLKKPAFPFGFLVANHVYDLHSHLDKFMSYVDEIIGYLAQQRQKASYQSKRSEHQGDSKSQNSHSIIQNAISKAPAGEKKLTAEETFFNECSERTRDYLNGLARDKSHSAIVNEMNLTPEEESSLKRAGCYDPNTQKIMDRPLSLNEIVYDLQTILAFGKLDPEGKAFSFSDVSSSRATVEAFKKVIQQIKDERNKAEAAKHNVVGHPPGGPSFDEPSSAPTLGGPLG